MILHTPENRRLRSVLACVFLSCTLPSVADAAAAPSKAMKAEVEGNAIVIYSSMKKAGGCKAAVLFSYGKAEQRQMRKLECNFRVPAQDHYRFCEQYNPEFIDIKIESAITGGCE
jgi:hypothetical protein